MLALITTIVGMVFVIACHTMEGFGKSIKGAGNSLQKTSRKININIKSLLYVGVKI